MPSALIVPMHLDALCVPRGQSMPVHAAMADFSQMPFKYYDAKNGSYANYPSDTTPNISERVLTQPFSNESLSLDAGVHLHWALPDALTHSAEGDAAGRRRFPIVPNRWLINRLRNGTIESQWVVESDYLYPDLSVMSSPTPAAVTIPFPCTNLTAGPYQPFRHMGRAVPAAGWTSNDEGAQYLGNFATGGDRLALTAVGPCAWVETLDHVSGSFAGFYPGCHSVFGFHDDQIDPSSGLAGLEYEVMGWYSDLGQDCLATWYGHETPDPSDPGKLLEDLQSDFGWTVDVGDKPFPNRTLGYARLTFTSNTCATNAAATAKKISVSVGSSGTEALSAYLASQLAAQSGGSAQAKTFEEQLEALEYIDALSQRKLDQVSKFYEARHQKGFTALPGGMAWSIRKPSPSDKKGAPGKITLQGTLPEEMAHQLNALNELQEQYDRAMDEIGSMSGRLFRDWYQLTVWEHPASTDANISETLLSNAPMALLFNGIAPLRTAITSTGQLQWSWDANARQATVKTVDIGFSIINVSNDYYPGYVATLNDGSPLAESDWEGDFENCGIELSEGAACKNPPPPSAPDEGKVWTVQDGSTTYTIKVEQGVMNLYIPALETQLATRLVRAIESLQQALAADGQGYSLVPIPQPRYWQPNEPTLLMIGDAVKPTLRHGQDGRTTDDALLPCQLLTDVADGDLENLPRNATLIAQIQGAMNAVAPQPGQDAVGFTSWAMQPWNPVIVMWDMQFFPDSWDPSAANPDTVVNYESNCITGQYSLLQNAVELSPTASEKLCTSERPYTGYGILSPHARGMLQQWIANYMTWVYAALPSPYDQNFKGATTDQAESILDAAVADILARYKAVKAEDPIVTALRAYQILQTTPCLSQALGGFNDTLGTALRVMQLPIGDPVVSDQVVAEIGTQVAGTVRNVLLDAPLYRSDFTPIRSGEAKISRVWVVDTFGQMNNLTNNGDGTFSPANILSTELMPLRSVGGDVRIHLPPRLTQPARVSFRWLSAAPVNGVDDQEMNAHPATSPICGWVVPNNLDNSLAIYDKKGAMLGVVDQEGHWSSAPGSDTTVEVASIDNPYLKGMVGYLTQSASVDSGFIRAFIATLSNALEHSDPEDFAQHKNMALLVGRPLALVRASVSLELKGLPARDESETAYQQTVTAYGQDQPMPIDQSPTAWTHDFDKVLFPVRIGEYGQYNDGLSGYWKVAADGSYEGNVFYSPQSDREGFSSGSDPRSITTAKSAPVNVEVAAASGPQLLAMLVDPRGVVHATSGVLPTKVLSIPPDQYSPAMAALTVTFLSAPLMTTRALYDQPPDARQLQLTLPQEGGYAWSWLAQSAGGWSESTGFAPIDTTARFAGEQILCEGWLKLAPTRGGSTSA